MDTIQETWHSIERLVGRLKLPSLIESCKTVWPNKLDVELLLPKYEDDLLALGKSVSFLLGQALEDIDLQVLIIACLYESTAFILSEELDDIQKAIRKDYVWDYVLKLPEAKSIVDNLYKYYRKVLLSADWFYNFGDLTSFWNFSWDLLEQEAIKYIYLDRDSVDLIEKVCFNLLRSDSTHLCIKGVTILEECIHRTRNRSLVNHEAVYNELLTQTWRLFENDERNQQISIVLLAALLECVRILEVDKNQLRSLVRDFRSWAKTDSLMEILLQCLERCKNVSKTLFLLEQIILLLTIDHPNIHITQFSDVDSNNNEDETSSALHITDGSSEIDFALPDWRSKAYECSSGRFHRWSIKLLQMIVKEVEKIENNNTLYFQYLACILFFIIDCPGLVYKTNSGESFNRIARLLVSFLEKGAEHLKQMDLHNPVSPMYPSYVQFFSASVNSVKGFMETMINNEKLKDIWNSKPDVFYGFAQILSLIEISKNHRMGLAMRACRKDVSKKTE
ncbi:uncharacterized protein LOC129733311 [Wyeomyia smithii]|uniref:uncharacterized protein LOC129733311 n=1 Tax=Wyeomyia smithii TaxID=174621 RepID=UPI0024681A4D|nr:uncharacterized protein LOC129733311 [Wyeomyia smithii]